MKDLQGQSYQEISESLQLNMGTVKSRLARSRICIKKMYFKTCGNNLMFESSNN